MIRSRGLEKRVSGARSECSGQRGFHVQEVTLLERTLQNMALRRGVEKH